MKEEDKNINNKKSEAALREEKILEFWRENKIFSKSLEQKSPKGEFVFYDGPVTANSKPVLHTMVPFSFKDVVPRYKTMRGFHVRRKGGWDTHGLPVELQIEKKLGFKSKNDIENYGIAAFNKLCKDSVWEYIDLWKNFTKRMGYWADQDNAYVTYHNDYIESVWNVVKKINEQNLLYKDYKVVPWCPRCGTALSSHELAQGYEDVKDLSVYVKFRLLAVPSEVEGKSPSQDSGRVHMDTYVLAWTTTPWTLPGNVALAVGENIDYVKIGVGNEVFILAKERLSVIDGEYKIIEELKGKDLIGLEYEPLYPYLANTISESEKPKLEKAYKIYGADFVTTEDGTGVVHTAVMYGQDDFELGTKIGLPKHHLVGLDGKFLPGTEMFEGRFVRDEEVAVDVIKDLAHRGLLFKKEKYEHSYPHCWRCKTALIYYARDSWYIKVSSPLIKDKMIAENKEINWEPAHIRDGRFGQWLEEIKDWAISRERYWGTPLPVWICESCQKVEVLGSIEEIKNKTKKSGNKYFVMRHGEANNNKNIKYSRDSHYNASLTELGKRQILESVKDFNEKIDIIISSPFLRAKQTAEIFCKQKNFPVEKVIYDEQVAEWKVSSKFEGNINTAISQFYENDYIYTPFEKFSDGESFSELVKRIGNDIYEIDSKYKKKNILIVGHGGATAALEFITKGLAFADLKKIGPIKELRNAEIRKFDFVPLPHNENYELDLHKPYIDEVNLICAHRAGSGQACGGNLIRTKEVMDVWFDSGCMPFAQDHYPFDPAPKQAWYGAGNKNLQKILYPADYICEAIDQTRGWFYTLHAVGMLMERGKAYKNVICLGHLLDAKGKKMSKSLGNIVDPWEMMDKYGVDTLRLWMYSVNQPGESKNFDEKTVALLHSQVFGLLYNVLAFYELYRDKNLESREKVLPLGSPRQDLKEANILDQWILARLDELIDEATKKMDNYKLLEPVRAIKDFIGDLSTWYLRRSRERIKEGDEEAKKTLYFVIKTLAKIMAPFAPLASEDIWLKLKNEEDKESVHLESWSTTSKINSVIIEKMETVRKIVTLGLEARQKAGIKVRQPLNKLRIKNYELGIEYANLIKDEINVKEIEYNDNIENEIKLDINITPTLKAEGDYREFMRELQDERKKMGLAPGDKMPLSIGKVYKKYKIMPSLQEHMLRTAAVASLICDNFDGALPKEDIVTACLLHDMGNILKFKLDIFPEFSEPESSEYWQKVKNEYKEKYGNDEHAATIKIAQELQVPDKILGLINTISFLNVQSYVSDEDFSHKIPEYCDDRVGPFGVVNLEERFADSRKRYAHLGHGTHEREAFEKAVREMEKQIFSRCKIKPEDINNETVAPIITELKNFVIHSIKTQAFGSETQARRDHGE